MMHARTHQFTREVLLACARREFAMRKAVYPEQVAAGKMIESNAALETDAMEAIAAVLENYPLASVAREAVKVVFADLALRRGFDDLFRQIDDLNLLKETIIAKLENAVAYKLAEPPAETMELEFE